ncbi:MAG TPA: hypothetical protein VJS44_22170 [Pyrinomonadaceae bacterium]|nr:hypothetical protein [Pyrinomonadaceae bacterium]
MPNTAGFAAAITVREHVLRTALQSGYANGSDASKKFTEDLSNSALGMVPNLFLGRPDFNCEGSTNLLIATLPMWGTVKVTQSGVEHQVQMSGEMELTLTPKFRTGPPGANPKTAVELDPLTVTITARRWTATVTSPATPPAVAALITGNEFRTRFEDKFRQGVLFGRITLPSIDASFLGGVVAKATQALGRVRSGVLLIGLTFVDANHNLIGDPNNLQDFAGSHDVAGAVHKDAADIMLDVIRTKLVAGVNAQGASLNSFSVRPRAGHFYVSGAVSKSSATVNFTFRVVPSMFHTRPGRYFQYVHPRRTPFVYSRTWPALDFRIEGVTTDVDRSWWVILFGEVILGILTVGLSILYIEGMVSAAASAFGGQLKSAKAGAPANRIRKSIPPPGGVSVRVGLDQFDVTDSGVFIGISVRATPSPMLMLGPTAVPRTYDGDTLRYLLRLPSGVTEADPGLRVRWTLEDRTNNVVLVDEDGAAAGRLRLDFLPAAHANANEFGIITRLYRRLGPNVTELGTTSLNVHMRGPLPPQTYIRWRSEVSNQQIKLNEATDTWSYGGEVRVSRWSEWHRTDAPCRAVNAHGRYRFDRERADRLPFPLRLLENHRKGLCPYCFYGGPAGVNPAL